jgi:hypothetical protein
MENHFRLRNMKQHVFAVCSLCASDPPVGKQEMPNWMSSKQKTTIWSGIGHIRTATALIYPGTVQLSTAAALI